MEKRRLERMSMTALYDNYEWIASHGKSLNKFAGAWIAVVNRKVIASNESFKKLTANPQVKQAKHPFITRVPMPEEAIASLNLH